MRRRLVALVTAGCFSFAANTTALANTPAPYALEQREGLPEPTPLGLQQATIAVPAAEAAVDVPTHVPAQSKATLGKFVLVLLALVGILVLVAIALVALILFDLTSDEI